MTEEISYLLDEDQRQDTMQAFSPNDVLVSCIWLNNPEDDHMGYGRIIQYDEDLNEKGVLWNKDTSRFVVGLKFAPDGLLWGFDMHDHRVIHISPEGKQLPTHHFDDRAYGNINWKKNGDFYLGDYFVGNKIHKGTESKRVPGTDLLGYGNIVQFNKDWNLVEEFETDTCIELSGFKGVTHASLHPSEAYMTYTSETGKRVMRYNFNDREQMPDLVAITEGNLFDRNWFIAPHYLQDGNLLVTRGGYFEIYDEKGTLLQKIDLGVYGYAQITTDSTDRFVFACNVWSGDVTKVDLHSGEIVRSVNIPNSELAYHWHEQQLQPDWKGGRAPRRTAAGIAVFPHGI